MLASSSTTRIRWRLSAISAPSGNAEALGREHQAGGRTRRQRTLGAFRKGGGRRRRVSAGARRGCLPDGAPLSNGDRRSGRVTAPLAEPEAPERPRPATLPAVFPDLVRARAPDEGDRPLQNGARADARAPEPDEPTALH